MYYLGISEDLFDAGATLCDEQGVVFASNEERYTRRKNEGGFPLHSLDAVFRCTGISPGEIASIAYSGHMTPPIAVRMFPPLHNWLFDALRSRDESAFKRLLDVIMFLTPVSHTSEHSPVRNLVKPLLVPVARRTLPRALRTQPIHFIEHHTAHTHAAWALSGFPETLSITADGMGDGLSLTVSRCKVGEGVTRLWTAPSRSSFGLFFELLAETFGFVSCRDEGKVTGLAACGDPGKVDVRSPFVFNNGELQYTGPFGHRGVEWAKKNLLGRYSREDISAWAQDILEKCVSQVAAEWLQRTKMTHLVLAGGVFANVKLNQRLHELSGVERLFVCPNMGDGGLSFGAIRAQYSVVPSPVGNVFWGDEFSESAMLDALRAENLVPDALGNEAQTLAPLLARGDIVARFQGRMEWGPRALGNRSILARTTDAAVVDRLNRLLKRSDFMPFAPALLDEEAAEWVVDFEAARHAAEFMTVCFRCTERMKREHPAVVHVDGTARSQLVRRESNPGFHAILDAFKGETGSSVLLNTSFNIHEEPIVRTPEEAVSSFMRAGMDYLAMGPYLVRHPEPKLRTLEPL